MRPDWFSYFVMPGVIVVLLGMAVVTAVQVYGDTPAHLRTLDEWLARMRLTALCVAGFFVGVHVLAATVMHAAGRCFP